MMISPTCFHIRFQFPPGVVEGRRSRCPSNPKPLPWRKGSKGAWNNTTPAHQQLPWMILRTRPWKQWQSKKLELTLDLKFLELFLFGHLQLVLPTPIIHLHIKQNLKIGQVPLWFHSPPVYPLIYFHVRSILFNFANLKEEPGKQL